MGRGSLFFQKKGLGTACATAQGRHFCAHPRAIFETEPLSRPPLEGRSKIHRPFQQRSQGVRVGLCVLSRMCLGAVNFGTGFLHCTNLARSVPWTQNRSTAWNLGKASPKKRTQELKIFGKLLGSQIFAKSPLVQTAR